MQLVVPSSLGRRTMKAPKLIGKAFGLLGLFVCLSAMLAGLAQSQVPEPKITKPPESTEPVPPTGTATADEAAGAVKASVAPPRELTAEPVDPRSYVIGPEDIIRVHVWREAEVSAQVQVRPDGKITLNLIGDVEAAGKTPDQLKASIIEKLSEFYNKPEVNVFVAAVLSKKYFITGEVGRPGRFPLVVPIRVLEAIISAGGIRDFGNGKKITILRNGNLLKFNYNEVVKGKNMEQNIFLENGDLINVP